MKYSHKYPTFYLFTLFFSLFSMVIATAQSPTLNEIINNKCEAQIKFIKPSHYSIEEITLLASISNVRGDTIWAYVSKHTLEKFLKTGIEYQIVENQKTERFKATSGSVWNFDTYPTYAEYIMMMDSMQRAFPLLCEVVDIGASIKGKRLLFLHINSNKNKPKPSVMYSSTMHGNETGGYVLMLRLCYYLLSNYKSESLSTKLIDSLDIWINPLANPDGAYVDSNNVWSSVRFNANGADLNRNFPDFNWNAHPDDMEYQPENVAMMKLMDENHFVLSANFHAGAEVVNYPWDGSPTMHPDSEWFQYISQEYADSVQTFGRSGYFTDVSRSGITDGYAWYAVYGGRQDYITGYKQGRELTIELDITKTTSESELNNLWNYNYKSLLHLLEQGIYGIHGTVTDSATGKPLHAKVFIENHDDPKSFIFSDSSTGVYYRPIIGGNYTVTFSANYYKSITVNNVVVENRSTSYLNVSLAYNGVKSHINPFSEQFTIYPNPCKNILNVSAKYKNPHKLKIEVRTIDGKLVFAANNIKDSIQLNTSTFANGIYILHIFSPINSYSIKIMKK